MTMLAVSTRLAALLAVALAMILAVGCASTGRRVGLGQAVTLQSGERVILPDNGSLLFLGVSADSRCPPSVQCIRAGDADVVFEFSDTSQALRRITVNTDPPALATIGKWQLRLMALAFGESPMVTVQIDPATP